MGAKPHKLLQFLPWHYRRLKHQKESSVKLQRYSWDDYEINIPPCELEFCIQENEWTEVTSDLMDKLPDLHFGEISLEEEWTFLYCITATARLGLLGKSGLVWWQRVEINELLEQKRKHFLAYQVSATSVSKRKSLLLAVVNSRASQKNVRHLAPGTDAIPA